MSIVKYKDSRTGVTYAYESTSYYDPEKKQARPIRKCLGRVDDKTGEIIPTSSTHNKSKKGNSKSRSVESQDKKLNAMIIVKNNEIKELKKEIESLRRDNERVNALLIKALELLGG